MGRLLNNVQVYPVEFTPADLSSGPASSESTITVAGLSTRSGLFFTPRSVISQNYHFMVRCSSANELKFCQANVGASSIGTGESTARGWLFELRHVL